MRGIFSHPPALAVFFSTEMWERYGFYVVQSLLALYLSLHFKLPDTQTYGLVGSFTALTYISPIVGGWLADQYLGQKETVLAGAVVLFLSYIVLASSHGLHGLDLALAMIAIGTGLLKPNISSLLGRQYKPGDPMRDSAFTIFYMGITTGIILGTLLPSQLKIWFGWHATFLSASFGLILAFFIFLFGTRILKVQDYANIQGSRLVNYSVALLGVIVLGAICFVVLSKPAFATTFFILVVAVSAIFVLSVACKEKGFQRRKSISFLLLCGVSVMFWAFYFQMFLALTLFITRDVQHKVFGILFPAPYYVSLESFGMILFGLILAKVWSRMKPKNIAVVVAVKFSVALFLMFLAYGSILLTMQHYTQPGLLAPWLILLAYLIISLSELMLSPVGLAAATQLSRPQVVSTMMGVFFVSLGAGGFLSGKLADVAALHGKSHSLAAMKLDYFHAFEKLTTMAFGAFIVGLIVAGIIYLITHRFARTA